MFSKTEKTFLVGIASVILLTVVETIRIKREINKIDKRMDYNRGYLDGLEIARLAVKNGPKSEEN